ncbi:MAG TPA: response regulator [Desulfurivibrio alkaliphilus]|uniref:Response regulator n=1 Tax=Desulfurivibrio alkaliphilus TaxID=427923 RepID=A0A7C2TKT2_9BACT|nr:response regulator [Desulfurivibrio alkaliphilus]
MRILLVDDEYELVTTLAERMELRGLEADWATSGDDALARITTTSYDVVVIDIKMPKISGIEVKRRMEKIRPGMKYIFMTGHGSEGDFQEGSTEVGGERYYLLKPVAIESLLEKINEVSGH